MSLDEATGAATATEPDEFYDTLNPTEQAVYDLIGSHGFRPEKDEQGDWYALSISGDDLVGPESSLSKLAELVKAQYPKDDAIEAELVENDGFELTGDAPREPKVHKVKQPLLPNTEGAVLQNLREAILSYRATTMDILSLQERQKDEKALVIALMHKFEDELSVDKETGFKYYMVETVKAVLEVKEVEALKTEKVTE